MSFLRLVERQDPTPDQLGSSLAWATGFVALASLALSVVAICWTLDARAQRAENQKLREAFAVMRERLKWSCDVDEGERIICAVKEGTLSRLALSERDQVVSANGLASPLGKVAKKRGKR